MNEVSSPGNFALFTCTLDPLGGWDDYIGVFLTEDAAQCAITPVDYQAQVVDLATREIVSRFDLGIGWQSV